MLSSRRSQIPEFNAAFRSQECSFQANKIVHQEMYFCGQCYDYPHGICKFCFDHCHKNTKTQHHYNSKLMRTKGYFKCECGLFQHKSINILVKQCYFNDIWGSLKKCQQCNVSLCEFCLKNCKHQHLAFYRDGYYCQCNQPHTRNQYCSFLIDQLKVYTLLKGNRYQPKNELLMCQMINKILSNLDNFLLFFGPMKNAFENIFDDLETGDYNQTYNWSQTIIETTNESDNINEKLVEHFSEKKFPYQRVFSILLFMEQLLVKVKFNLKYIPNTIWESMMSYWVKFLIGQYHVLSQNLPESTKSKLSQLVLKMLKIQSIYIKHKFIKFRKLDTADIENTTPISRNSIRCYNQELDQGVLSAELTELIKSYYKVLFDIEITNPILCKLLIVLLKCVKEGLQTGLLQKTKLVIKVILNLEKLCKDIDYYNQQKSFGQILRFFTEQMFNLLGKIIILYYFQQKDELFFDIVNKQFERLNTRDSTLIEKFMTQFYFEKRKNNLQVELFYNGDSDQIQIVWRVFINIVINYNLNGQYYQQQVNQQTKINNIIQVLLRENLFADTAFRMQMSQLQIEDLLQWKYGVLIKLNQDYQTCMVELGVELSTFQTSSTTNQLQLQNYEALANKCQKLWDHKYFKELQNFEKSLVKIFENQNLAYSSKNLSEEIKQHLKQDLRIIKEAQVRLFKNGLDVEIIDFFHIVTQFNFEDIEYIQIVISIVESLFRILESMLCYNQQLINVIYKHENYSLFERLACTEFKFLGKNALSSIVVKFHYNLLVANGFINIYPQSFINPELFCQHLIVLNENLDSDYNDNMEITYKQSAVIGYQKYLIYESLISILQLIINQNDQNHDYAQYHSICEQLYNKVLISVINHCTELFLQDNMQNSDSSYDGLFRTKNKRYVIMGLMAAIETIQCNLIQSKVGFSINQSASQTSFHSAISPNSSFVQFCSYTMKQLNEILSTNDDLNSLSELAITTVLLSHTFIRFMSLIIDYYNRNQLLEAQELSEQATVIEKIEQIHHYISSAYKSYQLYRGPLGGFDELVQMMFKFMNLINYSLGNQPDCKPPEIYVVRENNLSISISQKAIDDIVRFKDKVVFKVLNKVLLKSRLGKIEVENDVLEQNAIVFLIKKEYHNRSKEQYSNVFLDVLIDLLQQQTLFQRNRNQEYPHTIFMSHINYIVQLQRLLQVQTKPVQQIIYNNIQILDLKYPKFKSNFEKFLENLSVKIIPQLFQNVIAYQEQPYLSIVINSGKYSIIVLEFIRYLAEGQNSFLQEYVGKSGLLEQILKMLIDLLKSKQILEIVRETNQTKIKNQVKSNFQKAVRSLQLKKKNSSTTDYLITFLQKRLNNKKQPGGQNEFMQFEIHSVQGDQYGVNVSQTFLKLFAHTIITIAEFNQGQQLVNQKLTFDYLSKFRVWQIIIQILTVRTNEKQQNSVYTLRMYIFQLMLSLLEDPDRSSDDFQYIMNLINHKLLEETLTQTYRALIIFNKLELKDLSTIDAQLTELYRRELGDNINESLLFDSKMLIKILYQIYKMLNLYSSSSMEISQYLTDLKQQCLQNQPQLFKREVDHLAQSAFQFIFSIVGSIEYVNQRDQLETFHFLKPPMCFFLSAETKLQFLTETIDRSNSASKLASIFDSIPQFMTEMQENMSKYRKSLFFQRLITVAISPNFHHGQLSIFLTTLNFIVLILIANTNFVTINQSNEGMQLNFHESHTLALTFAEILLILMSFLGLVAQLFFRMSIYHQIGCSEVKHTFYNTFVVIFKILMRRDIFQFFLHFILSVLGTFEPFFFYLQSFCFIYISKTMSSVLEALRLRWVQFLGIFIVLLIILNAYSYIGFRRFTTSFQLDVVVHPENDIHEEELLCDTPAHCFISLVYFGLREGSGLAAHGDIESYHKSSDYYPRFLFDFSFFIIVTLIMINIINGIIIDTFAELRDKQQQNDYDRNNVCVICSLERWEFEKQGLIFDNHVTEIHNLSNYIALIVHLHQVGKQNMNGIETFIYTKIINRDMSWTPQKQTQLLQQKI